MNFRHLLPLLLLVALPLTGCIQIYRLDIPQGNVITQDMIDKLKPGMTRSQVRFVLGTPLITDAFHPNRWDYYYSHRKDVTQPADQRRLTAVFDGDQLLRLEGDVVSPQIERFNEKAAESVQPALLGPPVPDDSTPPSAPPNRNEILSPTQEAQSQIAHPLRAL